MCAASIIQTFRRLLRDDRGATATEYAVMLGLMVIALVTVIGSTADAVVGAFGVATDAFGS